MLNMKMIKMKKFKRNKNLTKKVIEREKEIDRIIKIAHTMDKDLIEWIICWLVKGRSAKYLRECNTINWEKDRIFVDNLGMMTFDVDDDGNIDNVERVL